jgi:YD repeat-containing protein
LHFFNNSPYDSVLVELVNGDTNHVRMTDSASPAPVDYYWQGNGWSMVTGNGARNETLTTTATGPGTFTKQRTIQNAQGGIDHQTTERWQNFSYGARLLQSTVGSGPLALTETFSYTADGMIQQATHSDGSWDIYTYDSLDRQTGHYSPFLNSPPTTNAALCRYTASTYSDSVVAGSGDEANLNPYLPRLVVNYVLGQEVSRSYTVCMTGEQMDIRCANPGAAWNDPANLVTYTFLLQDTMHYGEPSKIINPDGTVQIYEYDEGVASAAPNSPAIYDKVTVWTGQPDSTSTYVVDGTLEETWTDSLNRQAIHRITDVASQVVTAQEKFYYDDQNRLTNTIPLNRTSSGQAYDCCNLVSSTAPDGTVTTYGYDLLKRRIMTTLNGITVSNLLNANGDDLGAVRYGTDGSAVTNNLSSYSDGGVLVASTDGLGNTTAYTNYFDGTGQLIKLTTYPDASTRIETYAMDGSLLSVTGTAVFPERYAYGVESDGGVPRLYKQEIKLDASGHDTTEWTKTYTDLLGRDYKTLYSSASGTPMSQSFYNALGQLVQQVDPDGVTTLSQYNPKGEVAYTAVDMNTNGVIDFGGNDRITYTVSDVVTNSNNVYLNRTRTYHWNTANSSASNLVSATESSVDGLQSWNITYHNGLGLTNYSQTAYDPVNGYTIVTSVAPDGSSSISTSQYGRQISAVNYDANGMQTAQTTFGYDPQGRQNTVTDARNGTTTSFFNAADQVVATLTPSPDGVQAGQFTTNILDRLGRVIQTIAPDGTSVTNVYYVNGQLQETFGSRTYPVAYTYDYAGRMKTMTTWTNFASSGGAAVTTWNYDGYRGFLTNKAYADGKGPNYTYSPAGRLQTRTWARLAGGQPLATTYAYDNAGSLATMNYSDYTPGLGYAFDRLGRQIAVTNGATVTAWTYNDVNEPLTESYTGGPLDGLSVTNGYDNLLRRGNLSVLNSASGLLASTAYGYDPASRLLTVSSGNNTATYSYLANSPLVGQIAFANNGAVTMTTTKQYDYLDRLTGIQSGTGISPVSSFNYAYNTANQRTLVTNVDNSHWVYQYDNLGQVISGKKYWSDGTPVAGQQFTYNFDDIGNRKSTASGGDASGNNLRSANYAANSLNQYTSRDVPGYATVLGSANPNATVTVNLQRAVRQGSYFWDELPENNSASSLYISLTNLAVLNNGTNADIVATNVGSTFLPQTPESFGYDADGNMTNSGRWTVTWDAENRAVSFATAGKRLIAEGKAAQTKTYIYINNRLEGNALETIAAMLAEQG